MYVLVYGAYNTWDEAVQAVVDIPSGWLYHGSWCADTLCFASVVEMNVQRSILQEPMLYEFELSHNISEPTKNIRCAKGEDAVDYCTVIGIEEISF